MILWNFKAILWNFVASLLVVFLKKSYFWENWILSLQVLCGWIMFYSLRRFLVETWKRILHGRNGSNNASNPKKSWRSKNQLSRDVLTKTFLKCSCSSHKFQILNNTCEWFIFSKVASCMPKACNFTKIRTTLHKYFARILSTSAEYGFWRTLLYGSL